MRKSLNRIALFSMGMLLLAGCKGKGGNPASGDMDKLREENRRLAKKVQDLDAENRILADLQETLKIDKKRLQEMLDAEKETREKLQALVTGLGEMGADVEMIPGGMRISDEILFDSGSAELKEKGRKVLKAIAGQIVSKNLAVRIDGHTDGQPIVRAADRYPTNWDLSAARALSVLKLLEKEGVPAKSMHFAAFSEYKPVEGTSNDGGQAVKKNRRVEIMVVASRLSK